MQQTDILVISDSHGSAERIEELLRRPGIHPDAVFFLGDGLRDTAWYSFPAPLYAVRGNCDFYSAENAEDEVFVTLGEKKIFAAHGHRYSVKSGITAIIAKAASLGADLLLFGHTHEQYTEMIPAGECVGGVTLSKNLYILNPGSLGSRNKPSFGTVVIRDGQVLLSTVDFR